MLFILIYFIKFKQWSIVILYEHSELHLIFKLKNVKLKKMKSNNNTICNYKDYDYKTEFWTKDRLYEHWVDILSLKKLFNKHCKHKDSLLDAGCGFGRCHPSYIKEFKQISLFDYADNLLNQAKENLKEHSHITYHKGDIYQLSHLKKEFDTIISIRTLHHILDVDQFFKQVKSSLKPKGVFIFDVPNKIHLLRRIKYLFLRKPNRLYSKEHLSLNDCFVNHHPKKIEELCQENDLHIIDICNTNIFRVKLIKKLVPAKLLANIDIWLQKILKHIYCSPSLYYITIKK